MYNLDAFDTWWLKPIGWLGSHFYLVPISWGVLLFAAYIASSQLLTVLIIIISIPCTVLILFITAAYSPKGQFRKKNNLQDYFSGRHNIWSVVGPQYKSMKRSGLLTRGSYGIYGTNLLGVEMSGVTLPLAFIGISGCTTWIKLQRQFPHTIIDSTKDKISLNKVRTASDAKLQEVSLEGDFHANFKVYQEVDRQQVTLQILTPDRMVYLIDKLGDFNIEIHDNYLRIHSANAQKSSAHFRAFLDAIGDLQAGFKVGRLNSIH
jgi:hypothetical protein